MYLKEDKTIIIESLFRNVYRRIRQEINDLLGEDMTSNEFIVLRILSAKGPLMASAISKELNVSASHITSVTDTLVKKGFMKRDRSHTDRRVVELSLTDEGEKLVEDLEAKRSAFLRSKFASFSEEELDAFIHLIKKLSL